VKDGHTPSLKEQREHKQVNRFLQEGGVLVRGTGGDLRRSLTTSIANVPLRPWRPHTVVMAMCLNIFSPISFQI
jgi:hypothetical protein